MEGLAARHIYWGLSSLLVRILLPSKREGAAGLGLPCNHIFSFHLGSKRMQEKPMCSYKFCSFAWKTALGSFLFFVWIVTLLLSRTSCLFALSSVLLHLGQLFHKGWMVSEWHTRQFWGNLLAYNTVLKNMQSCVQVLEEVSRSLFFNFFWQVCIWAYVHWNDSVPMWVVRLTVIFKLLYPWPCSCSSNGCQGRKVSGQRGLICDQLSLLDWGSQSLVPVHKASRASSEGRETKNVQAMTPSHRRK